MIIDFGTGFNGIMDGIQDAIYKMNIERYIEDGALTIYLPELIRRTMEKDHPITFKTDGKYTFIYGVKVVQGYDESVIVVAYDKGCYCNMKPIIIKVEMFKIQA